MIEAGVLEREPVSPYWSSGEGDVVLYLGDCLDVLPGLASNSIDAIVTDPPAAVGFMGKSWDSDRGGRAQWVAWLAERMEAAARVLKPGGHLLVWSLPRTSHWTALALEDAGLEIRDCIVHLFGSGYPKSHDVSKAIDKAAGAATEEAARWEGFGTALKPGQEMWWLARKPLAKGSIAANVLEYGTGALNIAACKVGSEARTNGAGGSSSLQRVSRVEAGYRPAVTTSEGQPAEVSGRWPANVVFTHSASCEMTGTRRVKGITGGTGHHGNSVYGKLSYDEGVPVKDYADADGMETVEAWSCAGDCPVAELDRQSGVLTSGANPERRNPDKLRDAYGEFAGQPECIPHRGADAGGASRFFPVFRYQAKAPASERPRLPDGTAHPTVKPASLMSWLCRLITPPGGVILDQFCGSGATGEAAIVGRFRCILIDQDPKSAELTKVRLSKPIQPVMFGLESA